MPSFTNQIRPTVPMLLALSGTALAQSSVSATSAQCLPSDVKLWPSTTESHTLPHVGTASPSATGSTDNLMTVINGTATSDGTAYSTADPSVSPSGESNGVTDKKIYATHAVAGAVTVLLLLLGMG
ncbi:hypothetical protein FPQ18DRAFT_163280 [Pyronema domesticum]|uniref:Uncharacterized protein n=1 Tax=Pyronema omphalodes (strain CBS 100304) TaxID=1076935 RepID=U4LJX3_PYROM|nr:hypothetical protein FPQ18DRAFT_163280 [Pyronema domesticum]CCX29675.1 Protein of unknown function [Pyronema omphalodes CBS 100304]